jgi:oligopeptide transport system ATP-binding protein
MEPILKVQDVVKHFPIAVGGVLRRKFKTLKAVEGVSFSIDKGVLWTC